MSCPDSASTNAAANLASAAAGPKSVTTDGMTVEQHALPDLIAADRYLAGKCAVNQPNRGLRFNRLRPDGTVNRRHYRDSPEWRDA